MKEELMQNRPPFILLDTLRYRPGDNNFGIRQLGVFEIVNKGNYVLLK